MSQVKIQGNASGTGVFTVAAPNSNTDRTLTLPDTTGTVLNDQSDITAQVKTATNASGSAPIYACRAWVNFNGTGTVAIRASGNVSSITDNGTGDYTINFATAMPDTNYSVAAQSKEFDSTSASNVLPIMAKQTLANTFGTSFVRINTYTTPVTSNIDCVAVTVAIFR